MSRPALLAPPSLLALLALSALSTLPAAARAAEVPEAKVEQIVLEDDSSRIEELRVRGQTQRVTVQPKNGRAPAYEIIMGDAGRDLAAGPGSTRAAAGQRVWRILNF